MPYVRNSKTEDAVPNSTLACGDMPCLDRTQRCLRTFDADGGSHAADVQPRSISECRLPIDELGRSDRKTRLSAVVQNFHGSMAGDLRHSDRDVRFRTVDVCCKRRRLEQQLSLPGAETHKRISPKQTTVLVLEIELTQRLMCISTTDRDFPHQGSVTVPACPVAWCSDSLQLSPVSSGQFAPVSESTGTSPLPIVSDGFFLGES